MATLNEYCNTLKIGFHHRKSTLADRTSCQNLPYIDTSKINIQYMGVFIVAIQPWYAKDIIKQS